MTLLFLIHLHLFQVSQEERNKLLVKIQCLERVMKENLASSTNLRRVMETEVAELRTRLRIVEEKNVAELQKNLREGGN